jgi:hypothetical protein
MRIPKTHFDQIPIVRVKEIAVPLSENDESENDGVNVPPTQDDGTTAHDGWRGMARQIQKETDTTKMIELAQQLISKFDDEERQKNLARDRDSQTRSTR